MSGDERDSAVIAASLRVAHAGSFFFPSVFATLSGLEREEDRSRSEAWLDVSYDDCVAALAHRHASRR